MPRRVEASWPQRVSAQTKKKFWPSFLPQIDVVVVSQSVAPKGRGLQGWEGPKLRVFFPFPATVSLFVSLWGSSRGILVVFEAPGSQICTFGVLGLSCEALAAPEPGSLVADFALCFPHGVVVLL